MLVPCRCQHYKPCTGVIAWRGLLACPPGDWDRSLLGIHQWSSEHISGDGYPCRRNQQRISLGAQYSTAHRNTKPLLLGPKLSHVIAPRKIRLYRSEVSGSGTWPAKPQDPSQLAKAITNRDVVHDLVADTALAAEQAAYAADAERTLGSAGQAARPTRFVCTKPSKQ